MNAALVWAGGTQKQFGKVGKSFTDWLPGSITLNMYLKLTVSVSYTQTTIYKGNSKEKDWAFLVLFDENVPVRAAERDDSEMTAKWPSAPVQAPGKSKK